MPTSQSVDTLVVGAGLSGLVVAWRLSTAGQRVALVEARPRLGGRILSVAGPGGAGRFDLGPTWIWDDQRHIRALAEELGVALFRQFGAGAALFDQGNGLPPLRVAAPAESLPLRPAGGAAALCAAVAERLPGTLLHLACAVQGIRQARQALVVTAQSGDTQRQWQAQHVVVTLPPRLIPLSLAFDPPLPAPISTAMRATQTWMGQAMKVLLCYARPFWRSAALSGLASSAVGPVAQFRDASPAEGLPAALFGWIGNESPWRRAPAPQRRAAIVAQAVRLFGPEAAQLVGYAEQDWARARYTTAPDDWIAERDHPPYGEALLQAALWQGRLHWASSELSCVNGGYLDGAVAGAERIVARLRAAPGH